jgi:hypothetical protein
MMRRIGIAIVLGLAGCAPTPPDPQAPFEQRLQWAAQHQSPVIVLQLLREHRATTGHVIKPEELTSPAFDTFKRSAESIDWQQEAGQ